MIITFEGKKYNVDDELSFRDFTGIDFTLRPEVSFKGKVIYASCFAQEGLDVEIFNESLAETTFIKCNLDNVKVDEAIIVDCSQRRILVQNDHRDWELDEKNVPVKVLNEAYYVEKGISVDPLDIPESRIALAKDQNIESVLQETLALKVKE